MASKAPIFPINEPHHFSDYGFDPQIGYFQALEEARKQKREASRSIDTLHFKLPKPKSRDDPSRKIKKNKKRWWKNALHFIKSKWTPLHDDKNNTYSSSLGGSISAPVYIIESRSGSTTPYITTSRPTSGRPLAGTMTPTRRGEMEVPYINLKEVNMDYNHHQRMSTSSVPIYLVT
ncbi:hypothetical protein LIER_19171 [Lithospermum erythrorhizon]|uniref:Uncharacterized protein n=1 Tax=Lithospermum erythrorhizon TaxID=34254 RepID=A0AAV3QJP8_LITER